jgi:hypothetical protein
MVHVVVIDVVGGVPSALMPALTRLAFVRRCMDRGARLYTRVYPTSAKVSCDLRELYFDGADEESTTIAVDLDRHPGDTVFHELRRASCHTQLTGGWGLDPRLDAGRTMDDWCQDTVRALDRYGIDEFDPDDCAFATRNAAAQDFETTARALRAVRSWRSRRTDGDNAPAQALFVHLLGCRDSARICAVDASTHRCAPASQPVVRVSGDGASSVGAEAVPLSAYAHDPRSEQGLQDVAPRMKTGLARAAMMADSVRGHTPHSQTREQIAATFERMTLQCWNDLRQLDANVCSVLDALEEVEDATCVVLCHRSVSLMEHRTQSDAPFDSCLRGWALIPAEVGPSDDGVPPLLDAPVEARHLLRHTLRTIVGRGGRAVPPPPSSPSWASTTLQAHPSALDAAALEPRCEARSMPCFWARTVLALHERVYAVVRWWSVDDMTVSSHEQRGGDDRSGGGGGRGDVQEYTVDLTRVEPSAVFDLTEDVCECHSVLTPEWQHSDAGRQVLECCDAVLRGRRTVRVRVRESGVVAVTGPTWMSEAFAPTARPPPPRSDAPPPRPVPTSQDSTLAAPPPVASHVNLAPRAFARPTTATPTTAALSVPLGDAKKRELPVNPTRRVVRFASPMKHPDWDDTPHGPDQVPTNASEVVHGRTRQESALPPLSDILSDALEVPEGRKRGGAKRREGDFLRRAESWR